MSQANVASPPSNNPPEPDGEYPEQRHAGAVGLGPEYGKTASGGDKLAGWKEEIAGKILHNQSKVQHGKDLRTGELKKKQQEDDQDPFATAEDLDDKDQDKDEQSSDSEPSGGSDNLDSHSATAHKQSSGAPPSIEANTGPDDKAAKEQAATIAPEGTVQAETQRKSDAAQRDKQIG